MKTIGPSKNQMVCPLHGEILATVNVWEKKYYELQNLNNSNLFCVSYVCESITPRSEALEIKQVTVVSDMLFPCLMDWPHYSNAIQMAMTDWKKISA